MSYISHEDYKNLMSKFQAETPKGMLKEAVEEGNAFTAALAKTPKGGKAKVDGHEITDTSGYDDSTVKEGNDEVEKPHRSVTGRGIKESSTGDTPIAKMTRKEMIEFLRTTEEKAKGKSNEELRAAVKEKNEDMKEGLHMPPLQATGPTVDVTEDSVIDAPFGVANPGMKKQLTGPGLELSNLTTDERKQLSEFAEAIKTTKKAIEELLKKASGKDIKVSETMGGNHSSNLTMTTGTVSEDLEGMVSPKFHEVFKKLIKALKDEGLDDMDIQMFIKHEMEKIGKEAVMGMHDPY